MQGGHVLGRNSEIDLTLARTSEKPLPCSTHHEESLSRTLEVPLTPRKRRGQIARHSPVGM